MLLSCVIINDNDDLIELLAFHEFGVLLFGTQRRWRRQFGKLFRQLRRRRANENARVHQFDKLTSFILCVAVVGCADLTSPDIWFHRHTNDHATSGCRDSTVSWTMRCYGQTWTGPSHNCSMSTGNTTALIIATLPTAHYVKDKSEVKFS